MKHRAILFDFDYTLGDATKSIVAGYTHGLTAMGWPAPDREAVRRTVGYPLETGYTMLTGDNDPLCQQKFRSLFVAVANTMQITTTPLFPGARELLEALHARGIPAGVVSTKKSATLDGILQHQQVRSLLALVVGGDDVSSPKPNPEGLNKAAGALCLPPADILFCGDTVMDAEAACRAGMDFCAVLNGTTAADAFGAFPHVHIAPDLLDLFLWLEL